MQKSSTSLFRPSQSSLAAQSVLVPAVLQMDANWIVLRDVMLDLGARSAPSLPSRVCFALLHPKQGVVLLDIAPHSTSHAVERLRRALTAAKFHKTFPGHLAILYRQVTQEDVPHLADLIRAAFSEERATEIDGGQGWTCLARHVLGGVRIFDLGFSTWTSQVDSPSVAPPWMAEWRPAARSPGFSALGYFWAVVLATVASGAAFLHYDYVPPVQAGHGGDLPRRSAFSSDAPSGSVSSPALLVLPAGPRTAAVIRTAGLSDRSPETAGKTDTPSLVDTPATASLAQDALIIDTTALEAVRAPLPAKGQTILMAEGGTETDRVAPASALSSATAALAERMVRRADALLQHGDVSAARLLYERAAAAGSSHAATAMGRTFDAAFLTGIGVVGLSADPLLAAKWYHRGLGLGEDELRVRLQILQPAPGRTSIAMEAPSQ